MHLEKRLPQNAKEGLLYGALISTMTVLFMTSYSVILFAGGYRTEHPEDITHHVGHRHDHRTRHFRPPR